MQTTRINTSLTYHTFAVYDEKVRKQKLKIGTSAFVKSSLRKISIQGEDSTQSPHPPGAL